MLHLYFILLLSAQSNLYFTLAIPYTLPFMKLNWSRTHQIKTNKIQKIYSYATRMNLYQVIEIEIHE